MSYFRCPHCNKYTETRVTNGRKQVSLNGFRRRRECLGCGERYSTIEVIVEGKKHDTAKIRSITDDDSGAGC